MASSITDILDELQNISFDDSQAIGHWCEKLVAFYKADNRHSYSDITNYIIERYMSDSGGIDYVYSLVDILEKLKSDLTESKEVSTKIGKLIDHLKLEIIRMRYINELIVEKSKQVYIDFNNETSTLVDNAVNQLEKKNLEIANRLENTNKKIKNLQNESIAVLGIFSAVVLSFVGGLAFSTSVLQNIHQASVYRITFIATIIGVVLFNVVWILLSFLLHFCEREPLGMTIPLIANGILIAVLFFSIFAYHFKWGDFEQRITNVVNQLYIETEWTTE